VPGIAACVPRSVRTGVEEYLRKRERDTEAFDNAVLHARKQLKSLMRLCESSLVTMRKRSCSTTIRLKQPAACLKELAACDDATAQARLIVENRIPTGWQFPPLSR